MPRLLALLLIVLLIQCVKLDANDVTTGGFSERPQIEKRLEAAQAELRELPADENSALQERLQALVASCQYHLASLDLLDKAFTEAGIVISFPQRDLHFDPEIPLRIELSRSAKRQSKTEINP